MSNAFGDKSGAPPGTLVRRIDQVCDEFERAWKQGWPRLEEFLPPWPVRERQALFRELLRIDVFYRRQSGIPNQLKDYATRFPEYGEELLKWLADIGHHPDSTIAEPNSARSNLEEAPAQIGGYRIEKEIGRGGMGVVYLGHDPDLQRPLAIKIIRQQAAHNSELRRRFLDEARIMGGLQHPGIAPIHEIGMLEDGRPFFTMKQVQGQTLAALLKERMSRKNAEFAAERELIAANSAPLRHTLPRFLGIFEHVCQALAYAHSQNIIHRDLKPSNVMVGAFGEVQVMDWGLAKRLGIRDERLGNRERKPPDGVPGEEQPMNRLTMNQKPPDSAAANAAPELHSTNDNPLSCGGSLTETGAVMGTPAYMAPEQARGDIRSLDARSDVFGLGAILCDILTGQPAFRGDSAKQLIAQATRGDVSDALARLDACGADRALIDLARRCLAPKQADRPRDAEAVAEAVAAYQEGVQEKLRQTELQRAQAEIKVAEERKRRGLWIWLTAAAAALLISVIAGLMVSTWKWREAKDNFEKLTIEEGKVRIQFQRAQKNEKTAIIARAKAEENETKARYRSYVLSMSEAYRAFEQSRLERVHSLLSAHFPKAGQHDLRGFEWHLLERLCRQEKSLTAKGFRACYDVAWSPDGSVIAAGGSRTLWLWDVSSGKLLSKHSPNNKDNFSVGDLAFSPHGHKLAMASPGWGDQQYSQSRVPRMLDLRSGKITIPAVPNSSSARQWCVAWSSDGKYLASGSQNGRIHVWNMPDMEVSVVLKMESQGVMVDLRFSPDGKWLFASDEKVIVVWDWRKQTIRTKLETGAGAFNHFALTDDGELLAAQLRTPKVEAIILCDPVTLKEVDRWELNHRDPNFIGVRYMAFSPNGKVLATAHWLAANLPISIKLWHVPSHRLLATLRSHTRDLHNLSFSPDGQFLASGGDGPVRIWDVSPYLENFPVAGGFTSRVTGLAFSPTGKKLAIGRLDRVDFQDLATGRQHQWPHRLSGGVRVAWSANGTFLVTTEGSTYREQINRDVKIWDAATGKLLHVLSGLGSGNKAIAISPDSKLIATGSLRVHPARIWDAATGKVVHSLPCERAPTALAFSPDGTTLAVGTGTIWPTVDCQLRLWDVATGRKKVDFKGVQGGVNAMAFSPDGSMLASASSESVIQIWNPVTGKLSRQLTGHRKSVEALAFSPDGRRLASGSAAGLVKLWNPQSGEELASLQMPLAVDSIAFSPSGRTVAVGHASRFKGQEVQLLSLDAVPTSKLDPAYVWELRASALWRQKRFEETVHACKESLKLAPKNARLWFMLGHILEGQGNLNETVTCYEKAVSLDPKYLSALYRLAIIYLTGQKYQQAEITIQKMIKADARYQQGWWLLGKLQLNQKIYRKAEASLRKAFSINQKGTHVYPDLWRVYRQLGRFSQAVSLMQKARRMNASLPSLERDLQQCQDLGALQKRLPAVRTKKDAKAAEQFQFAELSYRYLRRYQDAVNLYAKALSGQKQPPEDFVTYHFSIAAHAAWLRAAVLANNKKVSEKAPKSMRRKALAWLQAGFENWDRKKKDAPVTVQVLQTEEALQSWLEITEADTEQLSQEEKDAFTKSQQQAEQILAKVRAAYPKAQLPGKLKRGQEKQIHKLKLSRDKEYLITLESNVFDAYLWVEDDNGNKLIEDDDGGAIFNSRLRFSPPSTGDYRIVATSFNRSSLGAFNLTIAEFAKMTE